MANKEGDPVKVQLIVGVLGFIGVLLTVFVPIIRDNLEQRNQPTSTPIIIVATPTVVELPATNTPLPESTATTVPDTPTLTPTITPTPIPPLEAGKDWLEDCLSVVWAVYPDSMAANTNGNCYVEPLADSFSVRSDHMEVFFNDRAETTSVTGIFVEIPPDSLVEFTVHLEGIDNGELWMGIFGDKTIETDGLVLAAPEGNMKNSAFVVRTLPGDDKYLTNKFKKDSGNYLVAFDVNPSKVTGLLEIYNTVGSASVPSPTKWLFLGYRTSAGTSNFISGYFSDLVITPR
ncbi:MAG: hypothetical protein HXY35_11760 [Chloroflexi bacterium]|nr:hypothetical protein [Chloroflexota bacterium]